MKLCYIIFHCVKTLHLLGCAGDKYGWMDERCFRPLICTVKAELGWGQPGLMRWSWDETGDKYDPKCLQTCCDIVRVAKLDTITLSVNQHVLSHARGVTVKTLDIAIASLDTRGINVKIHVQVTVQISNDCAKTSRDCIGGCKDNSYYGSKCENSCPYMVSSVMRMEGALMVWLDWQLLTVLVNRQLLQVAKNTHDFIRLVQISKVNQYALWCYML